MHLTSDGVRLFNHPPLATPVHPVVRDLDTGFIIAWACLRHRGAGFP